MDPMAQQNRAQFEANLKAQADHLMRLHQQAAADRPAVQIIDKMPDGPDAAQYAIPPAEGGGGDLISQMGADQARTDRLAQKAAEATGEGPPVPEDFIPAAPGKNPQPVGHIPRSLRAQMAAAASTPDNRAESSPLQIKKHAESAGLSAYHLARTTISEIEKMHEAVDAGAIDIKTSLDLLQATILLQYKLVEWLRR
jgi:hypothetical protein